MKNKIRNISLAGVIVITTIAIAIIWIASGFPLRYLEYISFYSFVFDIVNIVYFILLFKISEKTKYLVSIYAILLLTVGYFTISLVHTAGDCEKWGGYLDKYQDCVI